MSSNNDKATPSQVETITKQAQRLYKNTASTLIEIGGNFPLLNAIGKGDVQTSQKLVAEMIAKKQAEIAAYKASKGTQVATVKA